MKTFQGDNPSALHLEVLAELMEKGDEVAPRGKKIKEIRPASVEFLDPLKRVFFLRGRRINVFFNLAESLWIISGKSDVAFLDLFNRNMKNFSDDGIYFNSPYGERLRSYGKNDLHQIIYNPVDQLTDCYIKLKADRDTRQAVAVISAPHFDNSKYTIGEKGRDIACLTGDTVVASPEGDLTMRELAELDEYPVYSFNEETNTVEIKKMVASGITRRNAKIMKITLGDGTVIKATPDHIFYVKRYSTVMAISEKGYKYPINKFEGYELVEAKDLEVGNRLPYLLRCDDGDGYTMVNLHTLSKSISDSEKEHALYYEYLTGKKPEADEIIHHKNHKRNQNFASNLELMKKKEHDALDKVGNLYQAGTKKNHTPKEFLTKENLLKAAISVIESGKILNKDTFKEAFVGVGCLAACEKQYGNFSNLKKLAYEELGMKVPNGLSGSKGNPKSTVITKIEYLEETEDVYDITVEDNHNFFANGYLVHNCNLVITFKIRDNKLNMCVFNRSNDVIWGMFGANLCQFSTIQEMMAVWLGVEVGTYHQITDSLHIYTEDYGSNGNKAIFDAHPGLEEGKYCPWDMIDCKENNWWYFKTEPRMALNKEETDLFLEFFWSSIAPKLANDEFVTDSSIDLLQVLYTDDDYTKLTDDYWRMTISAMFAFRHIRLKQYDKAMEILDKFVPNSSWKVSMVYFLKSIVEKQMREDPDNINSIRSVMLYGKLVDSLVKSCLTDSDDLYDYLVLLEE